MEAYIDSLHGGLRQLFSELGTSPQCVELVLSGVAGEALVTTDEGIAVLKAGYQATGSPFTRRLMMLKYEEIMDIRVLPGRFVGKVTVLPLPDVGRAPLEMHFPAVARDKFRVAVGVMRSRLADRREAAVAESVACEPEPARQTPPEVGKRNNRDPIEEIRQLSLLAREGILSPEEFQEKKAELLARI